MLLEAKLGYRFTHGVLLLQACTHRSYKSATSYSYERLEFIGDALLDMWASTRLLDRFPELAPRGLTFLRALLVSSPTISLIALRKLEVHRFLLHSSALFDAAIRETLVEAARFPYSAVASGEVVWLFDPPKILGDVLGALLGAIWVGSEGSLDKVFDVLDRLYAEIMPPLDNAQLRDPVSQLCLF